MQNKTNEREAQIGNKNSRSTEQEAQVSTADSDKNGKRSGSNEKKDTRNENTNKDIKSNRLNKESKPIEENSKLLRIASWNIKGCRKNDKRNEIDEILTAYNIDVAALQEVNTIGDEINTENFRWKVVDNHFNKTRGLALLIRNNSGIEVISVKIVRKGIMWSKIRVNGNVLIIINIHAPNKKQSNVLSKLSSLTGGEKDRRHLILVGDFNAQLGWNDLGKEDEKWIGK